MPVATVAEPIKLKMAYFSSDREPAYVSVLQPFADAVNKEAKGVVEIVPYPGGVLGKSYAQQTQLVLDGVADMAWVNPSLTPERFPDDDVMRISRPVSRPERSHARLFAGGGEREHCGAIEDFFVDRRGRQFPADDPHAYSGRIARPTCMAKFFASTTSSKADALKAIGIVPVVLPVNEVALAIGRGTIDGATMPPNTLLAFGVSRITKYHYVAPFGAAPLAS